MAELIPFPMRRLAASSAAKLPPPDERGTILLFTGIRYERLSEPAPAKETPGPKKPRGCRRA